MDNRSQQQSHHPTQGNVPPPYNGSTTNGRSNSSLPHGAHVLVPGTSPQLAPRQQQQQHLQYGPIPQGTLRQQQGMQHMIAGIPVPQKQQAHILQSHLHMPQHQHVARSSNASNPSNTGPSSSSNYAAPMTQRQSHPQASSWTVPNPLGLLKPPPSQQQQAPSMQHYHPGILPQVASVQPSPLVVVPPPQQPQKNGVTVVQRSADQKPKVVLSTEAKQALTKAIWSAIRSPTGMIDPAAMQAAVATGLPEQAVRNAARVARERESQKRQQQEQQAAAAAAVAEQKKQLIQQQQQQLQQQQKQLQQQKHLQQQKQLQQQKEQQKQLQKQQQKQCQQQQKQLQQQQKAQQQKEEHQRVQQQLLQAKVAARAKWKRVHNGIFMVEQKQGRFQAVPFSVGAMVQSTSVKPVLQPLKSLAAEAALIQRALRRQAHVSNTMTAALAPTVSLLDAEKFKRLKIEPKKYARALDRAARKSRQTVADTLTKQYKELNKAVLSHQSEFNKFHRQRRADLFRLAKNIRDASEKEDKKREKDAVASERARLLALKANDMTAYSKLLEETRNDRLKYLLEKTEKHFEEITALLQERSGSGPVRGAAPAAASSYYASAHKHSEEVRQPSLLVGGDLKEYQLAGLQWMISLYNNKLNGILADEMGLGKTIQAISLIAYLMEFKHNLGPFLVIVPLSTLSNWQNEFAKWCPAARTVCYKGTPIQRRDIYKDQVRAGHFNVLLTTYEYIIRDKKYLRQNIWQYAIVDEGHRMKNAGSKFAVTLGTQYTTQFRVLLTGTPLMNDLSELWSLLNFLLPSIFNSVTTFDQWFSAPFAQFSGSTSNDDQEGDLLTNEERVLIIHRLHELLRPFMLRRVKSEVLDQLPEKVEKVLRCELSSWQKELYKQISKKAVAENGLLDNAAAATVPTRGLNNIVMQLRKVCNHPLLFSPEGYHINENIIRSSGKIALLDEMLPKLKAAGHRILMFTQMTAVMTILEDFFAFRGYRSLRLDGSTPAEEREKRMYMYNAPDSPCFIFLLSTRAGGLGLNLVSGDTVILFDSDWNPAMDLQAQDRAHRIGQRSDVSVFRLVTNSPVEEKILSRATEKMNVSQLVVESGKFNKDSVDSDNSMERKRLMELLLTDFDTAQPKNVTEKSGSDQGDDDDDDDGSESSDKEDLNELLSNNESDFQLYTAFDKQLEAEGKGPAPLFTSDVDVPDWIRYPQLGGGQSVFASAGDGARKRKDVTYDDGLTEKQFMRMMDKQSIREENARKKIKTQKGAVCVSGTTASFDDDEEEMPSDGQLGSSLLTDWTYRKLISCSKSVVALKDPSTKRRLSEIFLDKPDPATFPDYYEIVDKPIAINDILRKCRAKLYVTIPEFKDDWTLMFDNAAKFNGADSWVVQDAQALEKELERVLKKNGFIDDQKPPTCKAAQEEKKTEKKTLKLRIKLSLKKK